MSYSDRERVHRTTQYQKYYSVIFEIYFLFFYSIFIKLNKVAYGLTETSPVITLGTINDSLERRTQTIGKVMEHLEVKLVDKEGIIVPIGEPGELLVRGYSTMIGYWDDEEKTKETYTNDRFLKTG